MLYDLVHSNTKYIVVNFTASCNDRQRSEAAMVGATSQYGSVINPVNVPRTLKYIKKTFARIKSSSHY